VNAQVPTWSIVASRCTRSKRQGSGRGARQVISVLEADEDAVDALAEEAEDEELEAEAGSESDHETFEGDAGHIEQVDAGGTEADGERSAGERGPRTQQ